MSKLEQIFGNVMVGGIILLIIGAIVYSIAADGLFQTIGGLILGPGFREQQYLSDDYD